MRNGSNRKSVGGKVHLLNQKEPTRNLQRLKQGLRRVTATVRLNRSSHTVTGSLSLLDIREEGVPLFTSELLPKGSPVHLVVDGLVPFRADGVVAWSIPQASKVLTSTLHFRTAIQLIFSREEEKNAAHRALELLKESQPGNWLAPPQAAPEEKPKSEELVESVNEAMAKKAA